MAGSEVQVLWSRVESEIQKVIVGQTRAVHDLGVAVLAGGHVLLEGVPGTAKTLLVRALSKAMDASFRRIQFTPDLMPADITGVSMWNQQSGGFTFHEGPVFGDLVLADEINRAPAKTQSALLEAMQERVVTIDGKPHALPRLFTVVATQNPIEYEGTYPLPEAQLDRFLLKVVVPYPARAEELGILDRYAKGFDAEREATFGITQVATVDDVMRARAAVATIHCEPRVLGYVTDLIRATRETPALTLGASPRAAVALFKCSRAAAALAGRDFVTPDDVKAMAFAVLRHRVLLAAEMEVEGRTADDAIRAVLERVEVPK
ncbi:MAG: MoxR family ATPase [Planctomycetes bacterium]|nr:MoxR family ATPase [Planctomycetota bacterium]